MELVAKILASGDGVFEDEPAADIVAGGGAEFAHRPHGLPIGNLTSQFFAYVLLDQVDHFVKEELRIARLCPLRRRHGAVCRRQTRPVGLAGCDERPPLRASAAPAPAQDLCLRRATAGSKFLGFVLRRDSRKVPAERAETLQRARTCAACSRSKPSVSSDRRHRPAASQAWLGHISLGQLGRHPEGNLEAGVVLRPERDETC